MWQSFWDVRKPWSKILPKLLGPTKPLMGDNVLENMLLISFVGWRKSRGLYAGLVNITTNIKRRKQWVLKKRKKKHEHYQQTKGVRISLHAYLTSVVGNKTPIITVYQSLYSGPIKDSSVIAFWTWTFNNTPLRIISNYWISKQYGSYFIYIFPLSIHLKENMVHL